MHTRCIKNNLILFQSEEQCLCVGECACMFVEVEVRSNTKVFG